jgi:thiamine biosynthesis lipoprotein
MQRFTFSQLHMGVEVRFTLFAASLAVAERAGRAGFERFSQLDSIMSDYQQKSDLNELCRSAPGYPTFVTRDLFRVLTYAQDISRRTDGVFDITIGPFVRLWRESRRAKRLPSPEELSAARGKVGYQQLLLDPVHQIVTLKQPGMVLDLGGIAKGDACDQAMLEMKRNGVFSAFIEAGGDMVCSQAPPGTKGWKVLVQGKQMLLKNCAISTSGTSAQFVEIGGKSYAHIVNPKTGLGLNSVEEVSVIGPSGLETDPVATALCINPLLAKNFPELTIRFANKKGS